MRAAGEMSLLDIQHNKTKPSELTLVAFFSHLATVSQVAGRWSSFWQLKQNGKPQSHLTHLTPPPLYSTALLHCTTQDSIERQNSQSRESFRGGAYPGARAPLDVDVVLHERGHHVLLDLL